MQTESRRRRTPVALREQKRADIQALRALAVTLVLAFHFWPTGPFTGGYVGVDVFFVISGFLISGHLIRSIEQDRLVLREFWAKRARRLLPASLLVILLTVIATWLFAPITMWRSTFVQGIASALYVENIALTVESVDYLAEGAVASPLQHYWSLAVEEQLYIVWPLLLILAFWLSRKLRNGRLVVPTLIIVVSFLSLASSIVLTPILPGAAYFVPITRAWEFGAGAVVFLLSRRLQLSVTASTIMVTLGLAIIIGSAVLFDSHTVFPGYLAVIPVVGACLAILASHNSGPLAPALASVPIQTLGNISYSLYLVHWPLTVFAFMALTTFDLSFPDPVVALALTALSIPLALLLKRYVEDRFTTGSNVRMRPGRTLVVFATATAVVVATASAGLVARGVLIDDANKTLASHSDDACLGARAIEAPDCQIESLVLPPVLAQDDLPSSYAEGCQAKPRSSGVVACEFGNADSAVSVALVGDSHAASWFPALQELADRNDWKVTTYLKSSCRWSTVIDYGSSVQRGSCVNWNESLNRQLALQVPDVIVTSYMSRGGNPEALVEGFREAWEPLVSSGSSIIAINDTPMLTTSSAYCLFGSNRPPQLCEEPSAHNTDTSYAVLSRAAENLARTQVLDFNDAFQDAAGNVRIVVGGVVLWRDTNHFTATYSRSLADRLEHAILPYITGESQASQ